jgi:hypothetical protein
MYVSNKPMDRNRKFTVFSGISFLLLSHFFKLAVNWGGGGGRFTARDTLFLSASAAVRFQGSVNIAP